jgi:hypothetical protein
MAVVTELVTGINCISSTPSESYRSANARPVSAALEVPSDAAA